MNGTDSTGRATASTGYPKGGRPRNPENYDADGNLLPRSQRRALRRKAVDLDPAEKEARRKVMLARRLTGSYLREIATEFHCGRSTVKKEIALAKDEGLLTQATDYLRATLMPKALAVWSRALDEGDVEVATHVLEGLGVVGKNAPGVQVNVGVTGGQGAVETFEAWRLSLAQRRGLLGSGGSPTVVDVTAAPQPAGPAPGCQDGIVLERDPAGAGRVEEDEAGGGAGPAAPAGRERQP